MTEVTSGKTGGEKVNENCLMPKHDPYSPSIPRRDSNATVHVIGEVKMKTRTLIILLFGVCILLVCEMIVVYFLLGCDNGVAIHTKCPSIGDWQAREDYLLGKYTTTAAKGMSSRIQYRELEISSNHIFTCVCRVRGEWEKIAGEWSMNHKSGYIALSCVLDENGRKMALFMPVIMTDNGHVQIIFDDDLYMNFEKSQKEPF
jgi:hypothetical protein